MFFYLSKTLWWIADPANIFVFGVIASVLFAWLNWFRCAKWLMTLTLVYGVAVGFFPAGSKLLQVLENRFSVPEPLPENVAGIIVLGGVIDQFTTVERKQITINGAVERITEAARLARNYPTARVVYSGGSGDLLRQDLKEATYVGPLFAQLGVGPDRLVIEDQSRNTVENAVLTKQLVDPKAGETWLLVTSAFHMPRSVGVYRQAGWRIVPYPVDYMTGTGTLAPSWNIVAGMQRFSFSFHEWVGLAFYWLTGRSESFFPAPAEK